MAGGYAGKFLLVNLTKKECRDFTIDEGELSKYIGGSCLSAKLYLDRYPLDVDPLSPENPLFIMNGPMVGSAFPGTSRFSICSKSPQTGIWAESACGGTFGPELKKAGYDGIIIEGKSDAKVALSGFVDSSGSAAKNAELAKQRAFAVRDALTKGGIAAGRIELRKPAQIDAGSGADAAQARRVDIVSAS